MIRERQAEILRIAHLEWDQNGLGVLVIQRSKQNTAHIAFWPFERIRNQYVRDAIKEMVMQLEGHAELRVKNRLIITLPAFTELPLEVTALRALFVLLVDGESGRLFEMIPQHTVDSAGDIQYHYQMIAWPLPGEEATDGAAGGASCWTIQNTEAGRGFNHVAQIAAADVAAADGTPGRLFSTFRCSKEFREIIGYETEFQGNRWISRLEDVQWVVDALPTIRALDAIGGPVYYTYAEPFGDISGTMLRYLNTTYEILRDYPALKETAGLRVLEIGGGYGGLAAVFTKFARCAYTLIEVEPVKSLATKYLDAALGAEERARCTVLSPQEALAGGLEDIDMIISEYSLSELTMEGIEAYMPLFRRTKHIYLAMNIWDETKKEAVKGMLETALGRPVSVRPSYASDDRWPTYHFFSRL